MTDALLELLPVLVGLYLLDSLERVGPWKRLVASSWSARPGDFRTIRPGVRLVGPWPVSRVYAGSRRVLGPVRDGLYVYAGGDRRGDAGLYRRESFELVAYEDVTAVRVEDDRLVVCGREIALPPVRLGSENAARAAAERVRCLVAMTPDERSAVLDPDRDPAADPEEVRQALEQGERALRGVDALGATLFVALVGLLPGMLLVGITLVPLDLRVVVGAVTALWVGTAVAGVLAARSLRGQGFHVPRGAVLNLFLVPPAAARGAVALGRDLLVGFDPWAVALVLAERGEMLASLRRELVGIEVARAESAEPAWQELWTLRRRALDRWIAAAGFEVSAVRSAPVADDPEAEGFCAFCEGSFRGVVADCPECDVPILRGVRSGGDGGGDGLTPASGGSARPPG